MLAHCLGYFRQPYDRWEQNQNRTEIKIYGFYNKYVFLFFRQYLDLINDIFCLPFVQA
jgi:hypothetical protein